MVRGVTLVAAMVHDSLSDFEGVPEEHHQHLNPMIHFRHSSWTTESEIACTQVATVQRIVYHNVRRPIIKQCVPQKCLGEAMTIMARDVRFPDLTYMHCGLQVFREYLCRATIKLWYAVLPTSKCFSNDVNSNTGAVRGCKLRSAEGC